MELECVEITGDQTPSGSVIWLHGLGADGHDFEPVIPSLALDVPLRFVFPHAPIRAVMVNAGMEMRAWYDADPQSPLSGAEDIRESVRAVDALIDREIERGIAAENVVVAGFSQGGVIALELGLTSERRLRVVMALSTYLHDDERIADRVSFSSIDLPILMLHGIMDPAIQITRAITSRATLLALNYAVEWHEYGMGHQLCPEEINDISNWLNTRFDTPDA